jgi:glycosyltransferase involved in cell wall biosynthesis
MLGHMCKIVDLGKRYDNLKILLVNTRHFRGGGDSTYTFNLADVLRSKGHEVAFFAMQDPRNLPDPNSDLFVSYIDFRQLNQHKNPAAALQVLVRSIYSTEARVNFRQLLDRFQPSLVHLQNIHGHITPSIIFEAKKRLLPVIWTLHDYKLICPNSHFLIDRSGQVCEACGKSDFYQAPLRRCKKGSSLVSGLAALEAYVHKLMRVQDQVDAFLTPSNFLNRKLIDRAFSSDKVHYLPLFVPSEMFRKGATASEPYLLFLGKLELIKGIVPLLEACREAPEVALILAGPVEEPLASQLNGLLPSSARYVGLKHGDDLTHLISSCLAVVLPSLWYENQPFSILEAFAFGKPVIASDCGGMTELVKHQERGLLVRPGDSQAIAESMRWLVAHPTEAREMGQAAQRYALAEHSQEEHLRHLMAVYENGLRSSAAKRRSS